MVYANIGGGLGSLTPSGFATIQGMRLVRLKVSDPSNTGGFPSITVVEASPLFETSMVSGSGEINYTQDPVRVFESGI